MDLVPGEGSLEFDSVVYSYAAGSPVLKGVSFACAGGQTLALVGATGAWPRVLYYKECTPVVA